MPDEIVEIPLKKIKLDSKGSIRPFPEKGLSFNALKKSMKKFGLFHPILINPEYKLIAGHSRFLAAVQLGWEKIPCKIIQADSPLDEMYASLAENVNRKQLNLYEECIWLAQMKKIYEQAHPETKKGAYMKNYRTKGEAVLLEKPIKDTVSFIEPSKIFNERYSELLPYSKRTVQRKVRIGKVLLAKKFPSDIEDKIKRGELSQKTILKKLKAIEKQEKLKRIERNRSNTKELKNKLPEPSAENQRENNNHIDKVTSNLETSNEINPNTHASAKNQDTNGNLTVMPDIVQNNAEITSKNSLEEKNGKKIVSKVDKICKDCLAIYIDNCCYCGKPLLICNETPIPKITTLYTPACDKEIEAKKISIALSPEIIDKLLAHVEPIKKGKENISLKIESLLERLLKSEKLENL